MEKKDEDPSKPTLRNDEEQEAQRKEVRQSSRIKNLLFWWRKHANIKQERMAAFLDVHPTTIGRYENAEPRELQGLGDIIIAWAAFCGVHPRSDEVQEFLLASGNAPFMADPDCNQCRAELAQQAGRVAAEHLRKHVNVKHIGSGRDATAIVRHVRYNRASARSHTGPHPYRRIMDRIRALLPDELDDESDDE